MVRQKGISKHYRMDRMLNVWLRRTYQITLHFECTILSDVIPVGAPPE